MEKQRVFGEDEVGAKHVVQPGMAFSTDVGEREVHSCGSGEGEVTCSSFALLVDEDVSRIQDELIQRKPCEVFVAARDDNVEVVFVKKVEDRERCDEEIKEKAGESEVKSARFHDKC